MFYISILYANRIEQNKQTLFIFSDQLHPRRKNVIVSRNISGDNTYNRIRETDFVVDTVNRREEHTVVTEDGAICIDRGDRHYTGLFGKDQHKLECECESARDCNQRKRGGENLE